MPSAGRVARLDPRSGRVHDEIAVGSGPGPIVAGAGGVWVANTLDSTASLIDPARASVLLTQQVRGTASGITAAGGYVWVAAGDTAALTRLARDSPPRVTRLPSAASALTADGGRLLATLQADGRSHRGGTLRVRMAGEVHPPDTHLCCSTPPALRNASYDALLGISVAPGATGSLVPNLALAVPRPQDGGRTYTFHLRPGVRYWTGRPVRAADFRRGLEIAAASDPYMAGVLEALPGSRDCTRRDARCDLAAAVTADEAGTVTLHLAHPDPELLWGPALSKFAPSPVSQGPVPGTGPYRIARLVRNRLVDLQRNPYFRERAPAAQPDGYPDRILWEFGGEPTRSVADVLAGRADYTTDPPSGRQFADLRVRTPRQLHVQPVAGNEYAWLNTRVPPFDDIRVRRALALAVDRGALARGWPGSRPLCQIVPPSIPGHVPYCPNEAGGWTGPDLARARALIAASHSTDVPITYYATTGVTGRPGPVDTYMASLLRRLGYRVMLRPLDEEQWGRLTKDAGRRIQIGTGSWWADIPLASQWTRLLSCAAFDPGNPEGSANPTGFCDPVVDRLTRRAGRLQSTDPSPPTGCGRALTAGSPTRLLGSRQSSPGGSTSPPPGRRLAIRADGGGAPASAVGAVRSGPLASGQICGPRVSATARSSGAGAHTSLNPHRSADRHRAACATGAAAWCLPRGRRHRSSRRLWQKQQATRVGSAMKTSFTLLLALASAAAISAPSAEAASFKPCGSFQVDGGGKAKYQAKVVSCRAAKQVLVDASMTLCFDNQVAGWKKEWRQLPSGGKALTLKQGAKAIKTNACSPR